MFYMIPKQNSMMGAYLRQGYLETWPVITMSYFIKMSRSRMLNPVDNF